MAKIVYGISGEGSGHSSRAREMMAHLESRGHTLKAVSYDRGYRNLCSDFDVFESEGLHIASVENKVSVVQTFTGNLRRLPEGFRRFRELKQKLFKGFEPDVVITDFEPMTAYLASHYDLPLVSLDNQHRMRYMAYPKVEQLRKEALLTETVIRLMVPRPDVSLVTTFYFGEPKNQRTFLFPPILRREVRELEPERGEHVLVYFTQDFDRFLEHLKSLAPQPFRVYGYDRDEEQGNLCFRPFSGEGFLRDLAGCKAVIATAGFTLMTESLHLGKPYLALPMAGQFEQELNAAMLEELSYGMNGRAAQRSTVESFLERLPEFEERLAGYESTDNRAILAKLDELLEDDAAAARAWHEKRRARES